MSQCMEKYKNNFAIEFAKSMQINLPQWKLWQKEYKHHLVEKGWITSYFIAFLFGFMPGKHEREYNLNSHIWLAFGFLIGTICIAISVENKEYQNKIKKKLFPTLLNVFGENIIYGGKIPYIEYHKSMLLKDTVSNDSIDDSFSGVYHDVPFIITESDITHTKRYKNGKSDTTDLFKGIAMHFKMQKQIKSRVLIYSKGLFKNKTPKDFEKVEFEYEKFNRKYDVYVQKTQMEAGGQIEARYLFNTAFMDRFMQLQTSFKINKLKCSIFGDSMLVLLATNKDLFEMNHLLRRIDDIHQYKHLFDEFASVLSFLEVLNLSSKTGL